MPGVHIIKDERTIENVIVCENCGHRKPGRPVESFGHMGESRGWFQICFDCFKPRIFWREKGLKQANIWASPAG